MIAAPPSLAARFDTSTNLLARRPVAGSFSTKHFWLARMVARTTSSGTSRKAGSNDPISTTGHSTRPEISSSRPASSTSSSPCARARSLASLRMMSLRRSRSTTTKAASSLAIQSSSRRTRIVPSERKRWPRVVSPERRPSTSKATISGSSVSGPKVHRMDCSGRTQRSAFGLVEPLPQRMDFGQGKARMTAGTISATTSGVGRPCL